MKIYYQKDASLKSANRETIAIVGYGIIGRASALNLKDSGFKVIVGNIKDSYYQQAKKDGFAVYDIDEAVKKASIIYLLVPDQAQKKVYEELVSQYLKENSMLIFAHGFSIHFKKIVPPKTTDICLLAPRMPGRPIRDYFLAGGGVPAFGHVHQDASGKAMKRLLSLAKGIGYTKAGMIDISFKEETEIDLFIEHFLLPLIIRGIRLSFDTLIEEGFTPESTLMELYASGEIGELILMSAQSGIYDVWRNNASPTCQFGIFRNSEYILPTKSTKKKISKVLREIRSGVFVKDLEKEASHNYRNLKKYDRENQKAQISKIQKKLARIIKYKPVEKK